MEEKERRKIFANYYKIGWSQINNMPVEDIDYEIDNMIINATDYSIDDREWQAYDYRAYDYAINKLRQIEQGKKIILYTLSNCPICEMIKKKLQEKNIYYIEESFENCQNFTDTDRAPVMIIYDNSLKDESILTNSYCILLSPSEMTKWINEQEV